jgi:hypothetical protein
VRRPWRRLLIALAILGAAHFYIWLRFVHAARLASPWNALATLAVIALAPSLVVARFGLRRLPRDTARPLVFATYTWFGSAVYLLLAAALTHLACALGLASARQAAAIGVAATAVVVLGGLVHAARGPFVRRVRVPLAKLPAAADGYTIAQLTDVHIGPLLGRGFAERVVRRVNELKPDLIVITGDLVDGRVAELREHVAPLRELRARDGVFAVTGNHEYYWNADAWLDELRALGIRVLRNEHQVIASAFALAGVDDSSAAHMAVGHGEDIAAAVAGASPSLPVVLLAHHPHSIAGAVAAGCDLQLSGHTHGGQLLPLGWLAGLFEPRVAGLARFATTWLYVSEGTGFWGPPMRVGTSSEIALITLARG